MHIKCNLIDRTITVRYFHTIQDIIADTYMYNLHCAHILCVIDKKNLISLVGILSKVNCNPIAIEFLCKLLISLSDKTRNILSFLFTTTPHFSATPALSASSYT